MIFFRADASNANQAMQILFARAFAVGCGYEFRCDEWIGERIFEDVIPRYSGKELPRYNEDSLALAMQRGEDCEFRGYGQKVLFRNTPYTKTLAQKWLTFRPEIEQVLRRILANRTPIIQDSIVAHQRAGDYFGYGYPVISREAYRRAALEYFGSTAHVVFVAEEHPLDHEPLHNDLSFLPDFYRLMKAPTLMRANSSFSFVAGLLGNGVVLSPRIDGLQGGIEHDNVKFEPGNHCRLSDYDFCSDLHVSP